MQKQLLTKWLVRGVAVAAAVFGLLTIRSGGSVLFGDGTASANAGSYVSFVVWFNFLAGFAYVTAALGLWLQRVWATRLALLLAVSTSLVFAAFGWHIASGGAFEMRTVVAMGIRTLFWAGIALLAGYAIGCRRNALSRTAA